MNSDIKKSAFSFAAPEGLRVNMLASAYGIPKASPAFSWIMRSGEVGDIQTSYRILIASRLEDMRSGDYLLDTGWTVTDESSNVTLAGLDTLLQDNELYYWAVQLRNKSGAESALSEPMPFTTAPGKSWEDTHGIWCRAAEGSPADFCFLRTEFKLPDPEDVERAVLSVTASSPEVARRYVYNLYLNGALVGLGPTRIGRSEGGEDVLYYHSYDVTSYLSSTNALGAICYTTEDKAFLCQLTVYYKNGSSRFLLNSARDAESFFGMDGTPVFGSGRNVGTHHYVEEAENLNATLYPFGFDRVGFTELWPPVVWGDDVEIDHRRHLEPYPGEAVGRYAHDVACLEHRADGSVFIDLGLEIIGSLSLTVDSPTEHAIEIYYGEELCEDGSVRHCMRTTNTYAERWTLREGAQTLQGFGLKAFRYVEIRGCRAKIEENAVKGIAVRRAFDPEESFFDCSNEVLCRLYDTFKYAICATSQHLYVDSQSRERCPREGDTLVNMLAAYTYTSDTSLARHTIDYLISHRTRPAEYALVAIHLVRLEYLYSGNRSLLDRVYPALRRLALGEKVDETVGLIPAKVPADDGEWDSILVDWPPVSRDGYAMEEAHFNTVYNAIYYLMLRDLTVMAGALGKEDDATGYRITADNLRAAMIEQLYRPDKGAFIDGLRADGTPVEHFSQHATAYSLCMGIYGDANMKDALCRTLVGQDTIKTSVYGAFFLLDGLYRAGYGNYATALLASDDTTPGAHTFASALANGNVTIAPEAWCTEEKPDMTFSHPWGTSPAALIVRGMFGICPTRPGFHKFEVKPQIGSLPYAAIRVPTVKGTIGVSIAQNREAYEAEVTVPANTKATVYLPVLPGGTNTLFVNSQIANFPIEGGYYHIELGSGTHRLLAQ